MHSCMLSLWEGWRRCFCLSRLLTNGPVHTTAAGQQLRLQLVHLPWVFLQCLQLLGQMCLAHDKAPASLRHPCHQDERPKERHGLCRPLISSSLSPPLAPRAPHLHPCLACEQDTQDCRPKFCLLCSSISSDDISQARDADQPGMAQMSSPRATSSGLRVVGVAGSHRHSLQKAAESAVGKKQMCLETSLDRWSTDPRLPQPGDHGLRTVLTLP